MADKYQFPIAVSRALMALCMLCLSACTTGSLEELRQQTETTIGGAAAEVASHQAELQQALKARLQELEKALEQDIAGEKQRIVDQMDKKLAGAVTAFLVETLGHNVDLGAQSQYLTEMLEQHKAELIKEMQDVA